MPRTASQADRPPGYLSVKEAAERLGVHPGHLLRMIRQARKEKRAPILTPYSRPAWRAKVKYWFPEHEVASAAARRQALNS